MHRRNHFLDHGEMDDFLAKSTSAVRIGRGDMIGTSAKAGATKDIIKSRGIDHILHHRGESICDIPDGIAESTLEIDFC